MEFKEIQKIYENLPDDSTEEDVKIHVIVDMLQILGYKKEWMKFEARDKERKGVADILINLPGEEKIIVEVKSKKSILNDDSKTQLLNYLTNKDSRWGILTNGSQFLLVDNTIKVTRNVDKYFLEVSLDNNCKMNLNLYKFFSCKY
ncbi:type I restriction enzyme HsdR N-terminal domain-containing protein, partial [Clostridium perfringens]